MKIYLSKEFFDSTKQLLRKMRATCLLILVFASSLFAVDAESQVAKVNIAFNSVTISKVIDAIEGQTDYLFVYDKNVIDLNRKVSVKAENQSVAEVLSGIFGNTNVIYAMEGTNIMLMPKSEAQQQGKKVTGKVTDSTGGSLPGVSVVVKGTTIGVITDNNGIFSLANISENATLQFSFVGMKTKEVVVGSKNAINVVLEEETIGLDEVVAIGYGTKIKRDVTGSITAVKSKDIQNFKASSVDALLQGQGSGIQVSQSNGTPGAPVRVMIRGTHSIYADAEPLWVVDGIPISNPVNGVAGGLRGTAGQNPLATINPSDIESIEVLKDAAATSIYGSRGSNGVILVTTKGGKKGQGYVTFDASFGVTDFTRNANDIGFTNGTEWLDLVDKGRSNYGLATIKTDKDLNNLISQKTTGQVFSVDRISNTNWFDEITRKGAYKEYNLSISRGYDKGTIFSSINYRDEKGVLLGNDFKRLTGRINADFEPIENLKTGVKINIGYSDNNQVMNAGVPSGNDVLAAGGFNMALTGSLPIFPKWWDESKGTYFMPASGYNVSASNNTNNFRFQLETYRAIGGIYLDYTLPWIKGLSVRSEWSADVSSDIRNFMVKKLLRPKNTSYGEYQPRMQRNLNYNVYANYNRTFNEVHNVSATLGTESQLFSTRDIIVFGENFPEENRQFGNQDAARIPSGGFGGERYIRSYFARVNYRFNDRYIISGSIRRDGVSIFTPENRWSTFASGSLGWIFSEEKFMKSLDFVALFNDMVESLKIGIATNYFFVIQVG
ncbi:MAG: SusC/RagA family TonB-linked outer membrane protein [Mariniphaga sp.]|nr:SusC/RagA family TonB-linked outer membrane protein [Mariniphaga sp.]